jgi:hypothetical protein
MVQATEDHDCAIPRSAIGMDATFCSHFCIGGVSVRVIGSRIADVAFNPELRPFSSQRMVSDIDLNVKWIPSLAPTSGRPKLFESGTTWRLYDVGYGFRFDFGALIAGDHPQKRLTVDRHFRSATLQMSSSFFSNFSRPAEPLAYPLDELLIMHRLTQERGIELHGSGIVRANGVGNLFVGHSGAGKSTTTRLWVSREDVEVLSDDRIIVRPDEVPSDDSAVATGILPIRDGSASGRCCSPQNDNAIKSTCNGSTSPRGMRMYGTPWHGEAMFASPNSAPLTRIFILEHGHGNLITRLSKSQAVAELFARSFVPFHRHEYVDSALSFLERLADSVPCYRYAFEPDHRAVDRILQFHD